MANHRSPKPGLQVRLLPLLCISARQQESKGAPPSGDGRAATNRSGDFLSAGRAVTEASLSERRHRLLPLLFISHRWQESKAERPARSVQQPQSVWLRNAERAGGRPFRVPPLAGRFRSPATLGEFRMVRLDTRHSKLATP